MSFQRKNIPSTSKNNMEQDSCLPQENSVPWGAALDNQKDEIERDTHNMNYYVLIAFHSDLDMRPCRPVIRLVHLTRTADILQHQLRNNPEGVQMLIACQLCDPCLNTLHEYEIDTLTLVGVYALSVTDTEASTLINNVADINTNVAKNQTTLTERSNIALIPRFFHSSVQLGVRSIDQVRSASSVTDVQLCVILLRESLNAARSVCAQLRGMHPYLATPSDLQDTLKIFTRSLDKNSFKKGAFKFSVL